MSDNDIAIDPEAESYAFSVTRKMFWYTAGGTVAFAGIIVLLWYVF